MYTYFTHKKNTAYSIKLLETFGLAEEQSENLKAWNGKAKNYIFS